MGVPENILEPLLDFEEGHASSRKILMDGQHLVFAFSCYLESARPSEGTSYRPHPVEIHVLVSGDCLLTLHEERVSLPELLAPDTPEGRSEQYVVYAILDAMVASSSTP